MNTTQNTQPVEYKAKAFGSQFDHLCPGHPGNDRGSGRVHIKSRRVTGAPFDPLSGWHPDAEAVAVRDGLIVFVGTARDAEAFRGPGTRLMELGGATVIPGLIESHVHLEQLGAFLYQIDLVGVDTEEEAVRLAQERAAQLPPGTWILGSGWDEGEWANRYPTMELLSERVPDHPVYLRGLHGFAGLSGACLASAVSAHRRRAQRPGSPPRRRAGGGAARAGARADRADAIG